MGHRMFAIHSLLPLNEGEPILPSTTALSSQELLPDGVFLLENGEEMLIYVGNMVPSDTLLQLFNVTSISALGTEHVTRTRCALLSR
eukprot:scaffold2408_cov386-Prasinococcus_capsulatus_cf.AAC.19